MVKNKGTIDMQQEFMRIQDQIDRAEGSLSGRIWDLERQTSLLLNKIRLFCIFNALLLLIILILLCF